MNLTPIHESEEYVEQAYFFRVFRERLRDGQPAQEILPHVIQELLSTTRLPMAVGFMLAELRHVGQLGTAAARLPHYFTPFQAFVLAQAENEESRFPLEVGLLILEREAAYRAADASPAGLFVYELEVISRNRLGYRDGLAAMEGDGYFDSSWRSFIRLVRDRLGERDVSELIFARSEHYVVMRRRSEPSYEAKHPVLFQEKEGKIALANQGKDPMFLFATLQRQLGYPEPPRPPKRDERKDQLAELLLAVQTLRAKLEVLEGEVRGTFDLSKHYVKPPDDTTIDEA